MNDYLELFADWYPEFLGTHFYPVRVAKTFTMKERDTLLQELTPQQKQLVDQHRKYRVRSLFLKNSYMRTTHWRFSELKINPFYPEAMPDGQKLKCQCGRPLKFQFILESKEQGTIALGINHFADHLNIPIEVAREIQKGINEIDIALDELLWLKKNQVAFPEQVWRRYCYAVFRNNQLKKPVALNRKLPQRVLAFKEADMPVYIADYQALENEIRLVNQQKNQGNFLANKPLFEAFYQDFIDDLKAENLFVSKEFLTKKSANLLVKEASVTKLSFTFIEKLLQKLQELKENTHENHLLYQVFCETEGQAIQRPLLEIVRQKYLKYGFQQSYFLAIPRVFRNGLLKAIRLEKEKQAQSLSQALEQLPNVFFQTLAVLLKSEETLAQPKVLESYLASMLNEGFSQQLYQELVAAIPNYLQTSDFKVAFSSIDRLLYQRLAVVFE